MGVRRVRQGQLVSYCDSVRGGFSETGMTLRERVCPDTGSTLGQLGEV